MANGNKKRKRSLNPSRLSSAVSSAELDVSDGTLADVSSSFHSLLQTISLGFNDPSTADVILRLYDEIPPFDPASGQIVESDSEVDTSSDSELQLYVHSSVLRRAKYFSALFSDRWTGGVMEVSSSSRYRRLNLGVVPGTGSIHAHALVILLLYTEDFATVINSVASALCILPIALKLLFEDCIKECVRFLESVPWIEDEESRELLARVSPPDSIASEVMLQSMIITAIHNHSHMDGATKAMKAVVSLLRDFPSRETVSIVLERIFSDYLKLAKSSTEDSLNHGKTEAFQMLNLLRTLVKCTQLLWLIERMIEFKVAHSAVKEWSEQASFSADLQRVLREDVWRNIVPWFPDTVLECISKLAVSVAAGTILAPQQVRKQLVENWFPFLIVCKDNALPHHKPTLYPELEDAFLKIISTLSMADAQELLQQCLSFSTRDSELYAHLVKALDTWLRRAATRPPLAPRPPLSPDSSS